MSIGAIPNPQQSQQLTPEQKQQLLQALATATAGQQPRIPQLGGNNQVMPSGQASPILPGLPATATPAKQSSSMRGTGISALPVAVMQVKQSMNQSKIQKVRALTGQYVAMMSSNDPQLKQSAQALLADPKNHKLFSKAVEDPSSLEAQGVQLAYQDVQKQDALRQSFQEMQTKIQQQQATTLAEQQRATQEQATARLRDTQATQEGQVTPAKVYQRETDLEVARAREQATADREGPKLTVKGLSPVVTSRGQTYNLDDLKNDPSSVPPNVAKTLQGEYQTTKQNIDAQFQKQANGYHQQMVMYNQRLDETQKKDMAKTYGSAISADIVAAMAQKDALLAPTSPAAARSLLDAYLGTKSSTFTKAQFQGLAKQQSWLDKLQVAWGGPNGDQMQSVTIPADVAAGLAQTLATRAAGEWSKGDKVAAVLGLQRPPSLLQPTAPSMALPSGASTSGSGTEDDPIVVQ